jgi:patatin-like phospholipase/acyl hydrolase
MSAFFMSQAVRASSAAPYYLDDFLTPDGKRFQDGATTANNPAVVALAQARLLHPQLPIDVLVSLGCGAEPPAERSKGLSAVGKIAVLHVHPLRA